MREAVELRTAIDGWCSALSLLHTPSSLLPSTRRMPSASLATAPGPSPSVGSGAEGSVHGVT